LPIRQDEEKKVFITATSGGQEYGVAGHRRTERDGSQPVAILRRALLLPPVGEQHFFGELDQGSIS